MTAHPSHPGWERPPIPAPPTVCTHCGARLGSERADAPCSGEPLDTDTPDATPGATILAAAWHQHQEAHR